MSLLIQIPEIAVYLIVFLLLISVATDIYDRILARKIKKDESKEVEELKSDFYPIKYTIEDLKKEDDSGDVFIKKLIHDHYSCFNINSDSIPPERIYLFSKKGDSLTNAEKYGSFFSNSVDEYPYSAYKSFLSTIIGWHSKNYGIEFPVRKDVVINSAAPDMLEALKSIENDDNHIPKAIWEMRNKAIAKAENHK